MNEALPSQHPAVVLRSHYTHLRALLVVTMVAVIGLTLALVIVATNQTTSTVTVVKPAAAAPTVYNGGHDEGNAGLSSPIAPNVRYDGGIEEGAAGR